MAIPLCVAVLSSAACGGGEDPLEIGFRRVALDLAFKDADKAPPPGATTQVIRQFVDTEYSIVEEDEDPSPTRVVRRVVVPARQPPRECPVAPDGATPERVAFAVVKDPPKAGVYPRHNEGALSIELATQSFDIPVPPLSQWEIPSVEFVRANPAFNDRDVEAVGPPGEVTENDTAFPEVPQFSVTRKLLPGYSTTDTYRYTYDDAPGGDYLYLVRRVTVARGVESVFEPTPPIRLVRLNVPEGNLADAGVAHAGMDRSTNVSMAVQSQVLAREFVDVCGEVHDTYRVQIKEQFVDLSKNPPQTSGNEGETTNYWNIQFDNGLLIVREEVHSTLRTTTEVLGQRVPLTVRYNYTSTLDKVTPDPLGAEAKP